MAFSSHRLPPGTVSILAAFLLGSGPHAAALEGYFTNTAEPVEGYAGKYPDLIVILEPGNQLEFTRANGYLPRWRTAGGVENVQNLFPEADADPDLDYNQVSMIENGPDTIKVHWRHFQNVAAITGANQNHEPLDSRGITGVIHELFTIHADGTVEREVREATNTRYQDWLDPRLITRQRMNLTTGGLEAGPVVWGQKAPFHPRPAVPGTPIRKPAALPAATFHWSFDDAMRPHDDSTAESVSARPCPISGLMTLFKKGVSGTALALDGYYTGVSHEAGPATREALSVEAWVALDAYPYNTAPLAHQSTGFGAQGWYLGVDAYGHPLFRVDGRLVTTGDFTLPLYQWTHLCATVGDGRIRLYVDGRELAADDFRSSVKLPDTPLLLGLNNEPLKCTDAVRGGKPNRNLAFLYGIQGLLDEVGVYDTALSADQVAQAHVALRPADHASDLPKGVLPVNAGVAGHFGATLQTLAFSEVWDPLWRDLPGSEIVVHFDKNPCRVIYWRGTNHAPNWVTENGRWMADQSSENGGDAYGASEHMADKQVRHCHARIIENTPARVVIHWRYPAVGISYNNLAPADWSDEYHTIHPDGTGVRKVVWNGGGKGPGFQDIQFLTNPGEAALDVMNLQAMTLADLQGNTRELTWTPPKGVPVNTLPEARIELLNSKSDYKVFAMFLGGEIQPWGEGEQSRYTADPFAGPWNHWPMALSPSDGRFAVAQDRVTHFALGANDEAPNFGGMVLYGFTKQPIASLLPLAKSWIQPPGLTALGGCTSLGYHQDTRDFQIVAGEPSMSLRIDASEESPVVNPCFTIRNWGHRGTGEIAIRETTARDIRQGTILDTDGTRTLVVWGEMEATSPVEVSIAGAQPAPGYVAKPDPAPEPKRNRKR